MLHIQSEEFSLSFSLLFYSAVRFLLLQCTTFTSFSSKSKYLLTATWLLRMCSRNIILYVVYTQVLIFIQKYSAHFVYLSPSGVYKRGSRRVHMHRFRLYVCTYLVKVWYCLLWRKSDSFSQICVSWENGFRGGMHFSYLREDCWICLFGRVCYYTFIIFGRFIPKHHFFPGPIINREERRKLHI